MKPRDPKEIKFTCLADGEWIAYRAIHTDDLKKDTYSHPTGYGASKQLAYEDLRDSEDKHGKN